MCNAELNGRYTLNFKGCVTNPYGIFRGITNEYARWNKSRLILARKVGDQGKN